jgi:hypothetical protein
MGRVKSGISNRPAVRIKQKDVRLMSRFEEVKARIDAFCQEWPDVEYGPAHIVMSDYNLEDYWIDEIRPAVATEGADRMPPEHRERSRATLAFLDELKAIPEDERCPDDD